MMLCWFVYIFAFNWQYAFFRWCYVDLCISLVLLLLFSCQGILKWWCSFGSFVIYFLVERIFRIDCGCHKIFWLLIVYLGFGTVQEAASGFFGCNRCGCPCKSQSLMFISSLLTLNLNGIIISNTPFLIQ